MQITPTPAAPWGASWIAAEPPYMQRGSHALATEGGVWLVDPVDGDGLDELLAPLGAVRGVLQLLDRHSRDCAALAERFGVPHLSVPFAAIDGSPFTVVPVVGRRWWREVALWWPQRRTLVVAEALGTAPYYLSGSGPVGIHPMMRLTPPRVLGALDLQHLLLGHGAPRSGAEVAGAIRRALGRSRRDIPSVVKGMVATRRSRPSAERAPG